MNIYPNMRNFESGAVRDSEDGKADYIETISWTAMEHYAQYMTSKKSKYGSGNFKKGIPDESYERSLVRHVQKYLANKHENGDFEKQEDHLSAILFNVFGLIHNKAAKKPEGGNQTRDIPEKEETPSTNDGWHIA